MSSIDVTLETLSNNEGSLSEDIKTCLAFWKASNTRGFGDAMVLHQGGFLRELASDGNGRNMSNLSPCSS